MVLLGDGESGGTTLLLVLGEASRMSPGLMVIMVMRTGQKKRMRRGEHERDSYPAM